MDYKLFCEEVRKLGITHLIRETSTYPNLDVSTQLYAVKNGWLVGCFHNPQSGGVIYKQPIKKWSASKRKFDKVAI